jgi:hypothetical protein
VRMNQNGPLRPQWARPGADMRKLHKFIQSSVIKTISTTLNQEKWLSANDKLTLSKNLKYYITSQTQRVFENVSGKNTAADNQAQSNKKFNLAKKFFLTRLEVLYDFYAQLRADKLRKKWLRLMIAAQAKKKAEEESRLLNQQNDDHQSNEVLTPTPRLVLPIPKKEEEEFLVDDYYIMELLEKFDLKIGASLEQVEQKYLKLTEEYNPEAEHSDVEIEWYEGIQKAYFILDKLGDDRLKQTQEISEEELNDFADNLQPYLPYIKDTPVAIESIKIATYEFNMENSTQTIPAPVNEFTTENAIQKNLDAESPTARTPMQKLELTLAKLEHHFGSGQALVNIAEMLMKNQVQNNHTSLSPRPTPFKNLNG